MSVQVHLELTRALIIMHCVYMLQFIRDEKCFLTWYFQLKVLIFLSLFCFVILLHDTVMNNYSVSNE